MVIVILLAMQGATTENACEKITRDFVRNEITFSIIHDVNQKLLISELDFGKATGDYSAFNRSSARMRTSDAEFEAKGDRITTLLSAHSCPLPDHVTRP